VWGLFRAVEVRAAYVSYKESVSSENHYGFLSHCEVS